MINIWILALYMYDLQVPPEDYDSITDLVTTEEVYLIPDTT